jgi:glutaredoxin-related protein
MYVSLEMVRVINSQYISNDLKMYSKENDIPSMWINKRILIFVYIPSIARNTNILEELGKIQYLLSGKQYKLQLQIV